MCKSLLQAVVSIWSGHEGVTVLLSGFTISRKPGNMTATPPIFNPNELIYIRNKNISFKENVCVLIPISFHYNDVIMRAMASQIISLTFVYLTVYSGCRSKKTSKLHVTGLCEGNSPVNCAFPTQRASNTENASIWWCHHVKFIFLLQMTISQNLSK